MKCPRSEKHKGINAIVQCDSSPHYAGAWCAVKGCGLWIKWMTRKQYDDFRAAEDAIEGGTGSVEKGPRGFSEEEIRAIVRDELKKARGTA